MSMCYDTRLTGITYRIDHSRDRKAPEPRVRGVVQMVDCQEQQGFVRPDTARCRSDSSTQTARAADGDTLAKGRCRLCPSMAWSMGVL